MCNPAPLLYGQKNAQSRPPVLCCFILFQTGRILSTPVTAFSLSSSRSNQMGGVSPVQSGSSQPWLAGFMALCRPAGSCGVWEAQELWATREKVFRALGPAGQSPPGAGCMGRKKYQSQYADHIFTLLAQTHRRLAGNYLERKGRDDSLSGQRRTTRGGRSRSLSEHFGGPVCYRDRWWGSLFSEIFMNASKPRSIVTQPASRQLPPSSNQTTTFAPLMQKSWGQPSATGK